MLFLSRRFSSGQIGHGLFQGLRLATQFLHLIRRRGVGRVTGKTALAGVEELLRPAVTPTALIPDLYAPVRASRWM